MSTTGNGLHLIHLDEMLALQKSMNDRINPDWRLANYPWYTAVLQEASEAINHIGWAWWKKQVPNIEEVQLELVDIWHFILSSYLQEHQSDWQIWMIGELDLEVDGIVFDNTDYTFAEMDGKQKLHLIAAFAATGQHKYLKLFESTLESFGMTWNDLYIKYLGKNVLNFFRQDHGYKEGKYIKTWFDKEDNEFLSNIIKNVDLNSPRIYHDIYNELDAQYKLVLAQETLEASGRTYSY